MLDTSNEPFQLVLEHRDGLDGPPAKDGLDANGLLSFELAAYSSLAVVNSFTVAPMGDVARQWYGMVWILSRGAKKRVGSSIPCSTSAFLLRMPFYDLLTH